MPKYSISNDSMDSLTILNSGDDSEEEHLIDEIRQILALSPPEKREKMFDDLFVAECYQKLTKRKEELKKRLLEDD